MDERRVDIRQKEYELIAAGEGRCRVYLSWCWTGADLTVRILNENAHVGAVALGQYDPDSGRASVSVVTVPGHRDDIVAAEAAKILTEAIRRPVCVVGGVHVDAITAPEIQRITENCRLLVKELLARLARNSG